MISIFPVMVPFPCRIQDVCSLFTQQGGGTQPAESMEDMDALLEKVC
jgi:hypothetical protein